MIGLMVSCKKDNNDTQSGSTVKKVLSDNLKLGYHFDDFSGGLVKDYSGNNHDGSPTGLTLATGVSGNAVLFDNITDNLQIPSGLGEFDKGLTIDFWFLFITPGVMQNYYNILDEGSNGNVTFALRIDSSQKPYIEYQKNSVSYPGVKSLTSLADSTWYHIAFVYNGSETKIFLNGQLNNTGPLLVGVINSWNTLYLGGNYWTNAGFTGMIDELRICNHAFKDSEVKELMTIH